MVIHDLILGGVRVIGYEAVLGDVNVHPAQTSAVSTVSVGEIACAHTTCSREIFRAHMMS